LINPPRREKLPAHLESSGKTGKLDRLVQRCQQALFEKMPVSEALSPEELDLLRKRYSHFADRRNDEGFLTGSSHVVTRVSTPRPYIHLICSNHSREYGIYGSFWDESGSGFSCLDSVLAGPVTSHKDPSYVPTAPRATDHRSFFLRERMNVKSDKPVEIWHMIPQRGREEEAYDTFRCEQGLGTVRIISSRNDVFCELLVFVPVDDPLEVWRLRLVNKARKHRLLSLFLSVNWGLESYPAYYFDPRVVGQGIVMEELSALIALNNDKNNKHPRAGFLMSRERFDGFDMSGEDFTGGGHFRIFTRAVEEGLCRGSRGVQPYQGLIAAMQFDLELETSQELTLDFLLGVTDPQPETARLELAGLRERYFKDKGIENQLARLKSSWSDMINRHMVKTPDMEIDRFFNIWSKYQAKNTSRLFLALDKVPYRDILQYLMSICSFNPEYATAHFPTVLRHQFPDGRAMRQFAKFEGAPHDLRMYMDSTSWIPDTMVEYVKETGDAALLEHEEGFYNPETDRVETHDKAALYEHALRGLKGLYGHRGANGLCRIGHGDWNDSLDCVGKNGEGLSVWLSMALVYAARKFRELAAWLGDEENVKLMDLIADDMTRTINRTAWDGHHYVYAFMPDGTPVGSSRNAEGKIHLNVNAWSLFNGVAEKGGRLEQVLEAVSELDTPLGHLLLYPPYTQKSRYVGRIADIVPGQFENGSIYTHGQSFLIYGLVMLGRGDEAFRELKKCLPGSTVPDIATGPLHQLSNFTVGIAHEHFGRNLYSNFTGSLAWLRKSLDRMLGLLADFDNLVIDPIVPAEWKNYEVLKQFRGCRVHASFHNPEGKNRGVVSAKIDGESLPVKGKKVLVPVERFQGVQKVRVEVVMGELPQR